MTKPYMIRISSQKGGVGKTTIAVNLASALSQLEYRVLLVDADTTNPSVGFHLGLDEVNIGIRDVLLGKSSLKQAVVSHSITGMRVLPGTVYSKPFMPNQEDVSKFLSKLSKESYEFIIIDTAPGPGMSDVYSMYDEAIIITSPEMSACASSIRLTEDYTKSGTKHSLVVNRIKNKPYEINMKEIEEMYGDAIKAAFLEDEIVPISISEHIPACVLDRKAKFSIAIKDLSRLYASGKGTRMYDKLQNRGILAFLRRIFGL